MIRVAINGFGRIGRTFLRTVLQDSSCLKKINVVAINIGPANSKNVAHMFKHDSVMGIYPGSVSMSDERLLVDGHKITIISELDPEKTEWKNFSVDWVVESSGHFTKREGAEKHLKAGAKSVLISAPADGEDVTIIPGVNDHEYKKETHKIVSLGSCTTNAIVPMVDVLHKIFGIKQGFMTTVHAYTNTQALLDVERKDVRRSRAAAINIIPTTTGATKVLGKIIPELGEAISGVSLRVPVADVSLIDFAFVSEKKLSVSSMKKAFEDASQKRLKNILNVSNEELVSSDYIGNPYSVVIDVPLLDARENMGKVFGWYDNEWGYSSRLKDFLCSVA